MPPWAYRRASLWTLVTSGQVASMRVWPSRFELAKASGGDPWAENTTTAPSGTSVSSSTNTAPLSRSDCTTWVLWTISWRT